MAKTKVQEDTTPRPSDEFTNLRGEPAVSTGKEAVLPEEGDILDDESDLSPQADDADDDDYEVEYVEDGDDEDEGDSDDGGDGDDIDIYYTEQISQARREAAEQVYQRDVQLIRQRADSLQSKEGYVASQKENAQRLLESAKAALKTAKEDGETDAEIAANEQFFQARQLLQTAEAAEKEIANQKEALKSDAKKLLDRRREIDSGGGQPQQPRGGSKLFPKWQSHNKWFDDPKHSAKRIALAGIDAALTAEGKLDKDTPKYFEELGRRFNKLYPGVYRTVDGKQVATGKRQRRPGPGVPGSAGTKNLKKKRSIRLEASDRDTMEKFGMDPQNKEHLRRFLAEKKSQLARKQAEG